MDGGRADVEGAVGDPATAKEDEEEGWQPGQSANQNSASGDVPEPITGDRGATILGPRNVRPRERTPHLALATTARARGSNVIDSMKRRRSR
jgi:hypothetical protein